MSAGVGLVVVAAGAGRRLGGAAKALLRGADGATFLAAIAATARAAGVRMDRAIVVVAEPHRAATAAEAERLGLATVVNPAPERGMGSSVAAGFAAAMAWDVAAALLWPVDMPAVRAATVAMLCARASAERSVVPELGGRGGHPVAVGRDLWPALAGCAALPEGARSALRAAPSLRVAVDDRGVVADVDDAAALAALARDAR
jgi:CTP:molybdopterin cytidylyltransferase MocA